MILFSSAKQMTVYLLYCIKIRVRFDELWEWKTPVLSQSLISLISHRRCLAFIRLFSNREHLIPSTTLILIISECLSIHSGLIFTRFLESGKSNIILNSQMMNRMSSGNKPTYLSFKIASPPQDYPFPQKKNLLLKEKDKARLKKCNAQYVSCGEPNAMKMRMI